jgi:vitamin B12 transporter
VLARAPGVTMRRSGGLGSPFRFSINGLDEHAVRIFVDGVPIDRVYAMNAASVPVNLVDHVEVYRGVVPLRLGADALGGAVNLVRPSKYETGGQASYSVGSFGTHRVAATGRYRHEPTGAVAAVDAFFDRAENDYFVDVKVPDERGRPSPARVRRFHDAYQAYGAAVEAGVVERPWARKLIARAFTSAYDKQIQHNVVMSVPYGEPKLGERVYGGLLTYENTFAKRYDLELVGSYAHHSIDFVDKGKWVYNWYGERVRERRVPGEIDTRARDNTNWEHGVFGRANLDVRLWPGHQLTVSFSPYYATRTGDERIQADPNARDPLTAERDLFKAVAGLGYTLSLLPLTRAPEGPEQRRPEHYRIENTAFVKGYLYRVNSEDPLPGNVFRERDQSRNRLGAGNTLRVTLLEEWLSAKASYEYATRLPETYEVFGDGMLIQANLELRPEISHNANLGPQLDLRRTKAGDFGFDLNLVLRKSENRIILLGNDRFYAYQNVYGARVLGLEAAAKWTSPGRYVSLDGQLTYNDQRNTSSQGTFGAFKGDRLPNTPYFTASWGGSLRFEDVLFQSDGVEPFYQGRFVNEYFRAWESVGLRESKQTIPQQVSHAVGLTYSKRIRRGHLYGTFEVQNLTDARLYDLFGAQRPGRGYYFKLTGDI